MMFCLFTVDEKEYFFRIVYIKIKNLYARHKRTFLFATCSYKSYVFHNFMLSLSIYKHWSNLIIALIVILNIINTTTTINDRY